MPLTAAHRTASQRSTSGSAGLAGGFLPGGRLPGRGQALACDRGAEQRRDQRDDRPDLRAVLLLLRLVLGHVCLSGRASVSCLGPCTQATPQGQLVRGARRPASAAASRAGAGSRPASTASGRPGPARHLHRPLQVGPRAAGRPARRRPPRAPAGSPRRRAARRARAGRRDVGRAGVQDAVAHGDPGAAEPDEEGRRPPAAARRSPPRPPSSGIATTNASHSVARNIVASTHQRSGTCRRSL